MDAKPGLETATLLFLLALCFAAACMCADGFCARGRVTREKVGANLWLFAARPSYLIGDRCGWRKYGFVDGSSNMGVWNQLL